jgi:hypothetical protein
VDNLEPDLREVIGHIGPILTGMGAANFKNGFAPPGALLAALWGDEPRRKAPASLVFGSGAYDTGVLLAV